MDRRQEQSNSLAKIFDRQMSKAFKQFIKNHPQDYGLEEEDRNFVAGKPTLTWESTWDSSDLMSATSSKEAVFSHFKEVFPHELSFIDGRGKLHEPGSIWPSNEFGWGKHLDVKQLSELMASALEVFVEQNKGVMAFNHP